MQFVSEERRARRFLTADGAQPAGNKRKVYEHRQWRCYRSGFLLSWRREVKVVGRGG
jgi:hypothetical protein